MPVFLLALASLALCCYPRAPRAVWSRPPSATRFDADNSFSNFDALLRVSAHRLSARTSV